MPLQRVSCNYWFGYLYLGGITIWTGTYIWEVDGKSLDGYLYLWGTCIRWVLILRIRWLVKHIREGAAAWLTQPFLSMPEIYCFLNHCQFPGDRKTIEFILLLQFESVSCWKSFILDLLPLLYRALLHPVTIKVKVWLRLYSYSIKLCTSVTFTGCPWSRLDWLDYS